MSFIDKFKAGFDIGVKAKTSHNTPIGAGKAVYKLSDKWEKQQRKAEKKAEKKAKKAKK